MNAVTEQGSVWLVQDRDGRKEALLNAELGVPPLVAATLVGRGLDTPDEAARFLSASLEDLHDPRLLPDYAQAVAEILGAKERGERIYVHGDYDVDGVTSAALFTRFLKALGCDVLPHTPHRMKEGYGIHMDAVADAADRGARLFLTCDCGVSAHQQVEFAHERGMRVVVTDHHEVGETLPRAEAVVNPHRRDSHYPFDQLSGAGVVFKLCAGISDELELKREQYYRAFLDLAVLGTVADVMPLVGENRAITRHGLEQLAQTKKKGLRALLDVADLGGRKKLTARHIGFQIGPRINAVGRIDDSDVALQLMLTDDQALANKIARQLDELNEARRNEQTRILREAAEEAERMVADGASAIVVSREGWHPGVIGIVAGKLVEMFRRPSFVISMGQDGVGRGSARSFEGFHLAQALELASDHILGGGGHELAAGFSIEGAAVEAFRKAVQDHAAHELAPEDFLPRYCMDAAVSGHEAGPEALAALALLEPFGHGNPEPLFATYGAHLTDLVPTSNPDHARFSVETADGTVRHGMAFGIGRRLADLDTRTRIDLAFSMEESYWNGEARFRWILRDYRISST